MATAGEGFTLPKADPNALGARTGVSPSGAEMAGRADEDLVSLAVSGNRAAFEALVGRYQRPIINYLHRLTGLRDGATDLAQEVFIKVFLSLGTFDPRFRFTTWLYRIASNSAIDHLRKRQIPTCPIGRQTQEEDWRSCESSLPASAPTPDQALQLRELESRLEAAIGDLPVHYRQLILLRHRQHCRYDEIARITRLPIGTVKNRIFRARAILRDRLADVLDPGV